MKLAGVRRIALALPDTTEEPHFGFTSFRVRGRIFVTVPPDEAHIHVFVDEQVREVALIMDPAFLEKLLWGGKAVGLRVELERARPAAVKALVRQAYAHKAATRSARATRNAAPARPR
jgi:hypothetical protein